MRYVSWQLLLFRPIALRPLKTLHVHAVGGYLLRHRQDLADQPVIQRVGHGVLCSRYARETLIGFPLRVRLSACRRPLLQRKSAHQKGAARRGGHFVGHPAVMAGRTEPAYTARKGMCARETLVGFPLRVRLSARRRPLLQRKSAYQKGTARRGGHFWCGHGDSNPNA